MKQGISKLGKRILKSRLGTLLVFLHLLLMIYRFGPRTNSGVVCDLTSRSPGWGYIAGDYFHFAYEVWWVQGLLLLDFPALLISETILGIFSSFELCDHTYSWLLAILMLIFASIQWQLVGFALAELFGSPAGTE